MENNTFILSNGIAKKTISLSYHTIRQWHVTPCTSQLAPPMADSTSTLYAHEWLARVLYHVCPAAGCGCVQPAVAGYPVVLFTAVLSLSVITQACLAVHAVSRIAPRVFDRRRPLGGVDEEGEGCGGDGVGDGVGGKGGGRWGGEGG